MFCLFSILVISCLDVAAPIVTEETNAGVTLTVFVAEITSIGLYRDVWIAAIASSRKSPATQTAAICVRFQGRRVRHVYVTMHVTFLTRISALIYRRGLRQRVASLTLDCNGVFAIRAYSVCVVSGLMELLPSSQQLFIFLCITSIVYVWSRA